MQLTTMRRADLDAVISVPVSAVPHWERAGWHVADGGDPEPGPPGPSEPAADPATPDASPEAPSADAPSGLPKITRRRLSPDPEESS